MPKIKDLGVKVIPETMRPPEMGPGGGGPCIPTICPTHTICFCSPVPTACGCTLQHCTHQQTCFCSFLPTVCHFPTLCHCSVLPTICHPTICNPTICQNPSICHVPSVCHAPTVCACSQIASIPCPGGSGCGAISPVCGGSIIDPGGPISREQIGALKNQLKQQLEELDAVEKNLGPKTAEAIDARTKQIEEELAQLKQRRKELK